MAQSSRRPEPGDSAPDFNHLAHEEEDSDVPWLPPPDEASDDPATPADARDEFAPSPPPASQEHASRSEESGEEGHIFFESDDPSDDDPAFRSGETVAMPGRAQTVATSPPASDSPEELELDLPVDQRRPRGAASDPDALTAEGLPCFSPHPVDSAEDAGPLIAVDHFGVAATGDNAHLHPRPREDFPAALPDPGHPRSPADPANRRLLVILLASYASAVTIAWLWLWMNRNAAPPHELESLPDVAPLDANEWRYAPQNATMPQGHTIPLGSRQQLGALMVEPLRVTRGPLEFVHYADAAQTRPTTEPVLKLWLRFTNVSRNQWIAPLDRRLLFTRNYQPETDNILANQIVLTPESKNTGAPPAYVFDHPITSEWDLKDQRLGQRLKPGESIVTYIPLEPGADEHFRGSLLWRVHLRKGYNVQTGHGVTTMIEVPFHTSHVRNEPSSA